MDRLWTRKIMAASAALVALSVPLNAPQAYGGIITVGEVVQFKRTITYQALEIEKIQTETSVFVKSFPPQETFSSFRKLTELTISSITVTIDVYNIYPLEIHVPQPFDFFDPIDMYFVLAADVGQGIGPLPDGVELLQGTGMFGSNGGLFEAEITPINDLANLPVLSANDDLIVWDLSGLSQTTGNFFLAKVTLSGKELIPAPASLALLGLGGLVAGRRRRR